jgi:carbamoyl-phosphate synthase large subunit
VDEAPLPCIVKPSKGSGGSAFVFYAHTRQEVRLYDAYLQSNGRHAIAQEYVPEEGGEFTAGVLSAPDGSVRGAIVLKRAFPAKLSIAARSRDFLISSGITQGHVGEYPAVSDVVIKIAVAVGSTGPINVQGRIDSQGRFLPFEINPRFSASTYLRAMAGFNEVDYYIQLIFGESLPSLEARAGWYLRGLSEVFVENGSVLT